MASGTSSRQSKEPAMPENIPAASTSGRRSQHGFAQRIVSFIRQPGRWYSVLQKRANTLFPEPAVFHITHYKAGSQWIFRILKAICEDRIVHAQPGCAHFLGQTLRPSGVYPTVYVTREEFEAADTPRNSSKFIVIRDLRDTLISGYFSLKTSHTPMNNKMIEVRGQLQDQTVADGLQMLMERWLRVNATIQRSWVGSSDPLIRYEDLLADDLGILEPLFLNHCGMRIAPEALRAAIVANRFEARSGRKRGDEDTSSHERKGVAGDWRNYFTDKLASKFKELYGDLLIATGYESNDRW
jgi:lipopolysaccharide transport system ATP-binding protein